MSEKRIICEMAEWAAGLSRGSVPASALHAARRLLIDRIAISLGGYRLIGPHPTYHLAERMDGRPAATIWSTGSKTFAPYAAMANGSAGDILELEAGPECAESALAAAEIADATLGDLLAAIAVAGEVAGYMRRWLSEPMERHGLHHPAALGAYSSATAAGRLLGLTPAQLAGALGLAGALAPQAPYGAFSAGASGKTLYGGWPHLLGLWSCLWAIQGVAAPVTLLEGRHEPPAETAIHTCIYRARSDVVSVAHFHPYFATLFAIAGKPLLPVSSHGAIFGNAVPVYMDPDHVTDKERGESLARSLGESRAVLMRGHGVTVVGESVEACFTACIYLEENARRLYHASLLGPPLSFDEDEIRRVAKSTWKEKSFKKLWDHFESRARRWNSED